MLHGTAHLPWSQLTFERIWFWFHAFLLHQFLTPFLNLLIPIYNVFLEGLGDGTKWNQERVACVGISQMHQRQLTTGGCRAPIGLQSCLSCPKGGKMATIAALWEELKGTTMAGVLSCPSDLEIETAVILEKENLTNQVKTSHFPSPSLWRIWHL